MIATWCASVHKARIARSTDITHTSEQMLSNRIHSVRMPQRERSSVCWQEGLVMCCVASTSSVIRGHASPVCVAMICWRHLQRVWQHHRHRHALAQGKLGWVGGFQGLQSRNVRSRPRGQCWHMRGKVCMPAFKCQQQSLGRASHERALQNRSIHVLPDVRPDLCRTPTAIWLHTSLPYTAACNQWGTAQHGTPPQPQPHHHHRHHGRTCKVSYTGTQARLQCIMPTTRCKAG